MVNPSTGDSNRMPRWVKVFGIVAVILGLLFAIHLIFIGGQSGMHSLSGGS